MDLSETLRDFRNGNGPFGNVSRLQRSGEAIFPIKSIYSLQLFAELLLGRR
jgi:hypothetical protein